MVKTPDKVKSLEYIGNCITLPIRFLEQLEDEATRANKKTINKLVKEHLPDLHYNLALNSYNPYNYYKTKDYLILVHSSIEYVIKYRI